MNFPTGLQGSGLHNLFEAAPSPSKILKHKQDKDSVGVLETQNLGF